MKWLPFLFQPCNLNECGWCALILIALSRATVVAYQILRGAPPLHRAPYYDRYALNLLLDTWHSCNNSKGWGMKGGLGGMGTSSFPVWWRDLGCALVASPAISVVIGEERRRGGGQGWCQAKRRGPLPPTASRGEVQVVMPAPNANLYGGRCGRFWRGMNCIEGYEFSILKED